MATSCPVCKDSPLAKQQLEENLNSDKCSKCSGVWIGATQYDHWISRHEVNHPEKAPEEGVTLSSNEKGGAKFCPDCKYMLIKYKVGRSLPFTLNKCGHCGGIWLDGNEWEILKSRNLHDDVHMIFSDAWQDAVRADENKKAMDEIWRDHLGDDLEEIRRIKNWILKHPKSGELYSYLVYNMDEEARAAKEAAAK